jgi:DNA-3-methyladenine glycosylase II
VRRLNAASLRTGCEALSSADSRLAALLERNGLPPLRLRPEGFATLVHLILQQQVSRASAQAVLDRLLAHVGGDVTADALLAIDPVDLRAMGWSRQKIDYASSLANGIVSGGFDLAGLAGLDDEAAIDVLEGQRGIGPWTAAVYVLTALGRPDVWAPGDRALLVSLGWMLGRQEVPDSKEAAEIALAWRPWRAVAARILWHDYGSGGRR